MTRFLTPAQARETMPCPLARTFAEKKGPNCDADRCPVWRWRAPLDMPPGFLSAVKREMACLAQEEAERTGKKVSDQKFHQRAVANVNHDPEAYGVQMPKDKGFCGLGGKPE